MLRFLAVENMYDLDYILLLINLNNQAILLMRLIENAEGGKMRRNSIDCLLLVGWAERGLCHFIAELEMPFLLSFVVQLIIVLACCESSQIYCIVCY